MKADEDLSFDGPVTARPKRSTIEDAIDRVPTIDDHPDQAPPASYQDWRPEDTKIVTYTIDSSGYPGLPATTRESAKTMCELVHGAILEANYVPGRAFFRVRRVRG